MSLPIESTAPTSSYRIQTRPNSSMPKSSAAPTSSGSPQRRCHNTLRRRCLPQAERRVGLSRRGIHNSGIHRSRVRQSDRQAARRGSLSLPALPAGYREGHKALKPRPGTRSNSERCGRKFRSSYPYASTCRLGAGKHAKLSVKSV